MEGFVYWAPPNDWNVDTSESTMGLTLRVTFYRLAETMAMAAAVVTMAVAGVCQVGAAAVAPELFTFVVSCRLRFRDRLCLVIASVHSFVVLHTSK